jgi:flagellar biosynthetic protein FliP
MSAIGIRKPELRQLWLALPLLALAPALAFAAPELPKVPSDTAQALRVVLGLSVLAVLPALLVCITSFLRIIIVLSMLRHAIGMPETPPNPVLIGLALFFTLFTMAPVLATLNDQALQPFMNGSAWTRRTPRGSRPCANSWCARRGSRTLR